MLRRNRPRNLDDLCVEVAIVRPGPIVGGAVNPYVRRREDQRRAVAAGKQYKPPLPHPLLKEALTETLGVILFQDQVLQVCEALAGFTPGQGEDLRRAMSRRRSRELMGAFWETFRDGAVKRGVPESVAESVFKQVVGFSAFGFPKSHAAAFGLLAYQSAWLRHYYPVEFYVGLFNNQPMGFYSIDVLCRDADRHGVKVMLPHLNKSDVYCSVEDESIRVGLGFTRGWGWDVAEEVVVERERNGPFRSVGDLVRRSPPTLSRTAVENLIWVGGLDFLGLNRRDLIWQAGLFLPPKTEDRAGLPRGQYELALTHPYDNVRFANLGSEDLLLAEYDVLGFSTGGHPLTLLRDNLPRHIARSTDLPSTQHDSVVFVAGLVVAIQRPETAKGVVFILMEDETGMTNVIVPPPVFEKCRIAIRGEPFLKIKGKVAQDDGTVNLIALEVSALEVKPQVRNVPITTGKNPRSFLKKLRGSAPPSRQFH
jgi:error-prone DNA polymerase